MELLLFIVCYVISGISIGLMCAGPFGVAAGVFLGVVGGLICAFAGILVMAE